MGSGTNNKTSHAQYTSELQLQVTYNLHLLKDIRWDLFFLLYLLILHLTQTLICVSP
jgi:hypothetical protein